MRYEIDTREELIVALNEAVQIEHGLMLQYLFAAFTLKQEEEEGLTWEEAESALAWKADLLRIARDEMGHLGTVMNMLSAIGGVPVLQRPNFPLAAGRWFPFPFELTRYSVATLQRFIRFEEPEPAVLAFFALPRQPTYTYVGELYRAIRRGFEAVGSAGGLFIGNPAAQDAGSWERLNFPPRAIASVADAVAAIDALVLQGEGDGSDPQAHHMTFRRLLAELNAAQQARPDFDPARNVAPNPALRPHPEAGDSSVAIHEDSSEGRIAALIVIYYGTLLQALSIYYDGSVAGEAAREDLRRFMRTVMMGLVRPLSEILTTLPIVADPQGRNAGPTFEIIGPIVSPAFPAARWVLIRERLENALAGLQAAAAEAPSLSRLATLVPSAQGVVANIRELEAGA